MTRVTIFLIFLIICHEVMNIEARYLKRSRCKKGSRHGHEKSTTLINAANDVSNLPQQQEQNSKAEHAVDDFRPTSPGHSPGVGHSINN